MNQYAGFFGNQNMYGTFSALITPYVLFHWRIVAQKKWQKWSTESVDLSKQIVVEAAKGAKADEKTLKKLLTTLNARCTDCHNAFRDDE